jgi:hypothetical protein
MVQQKAMAALEKKAAAGDTMAARDLVVLQEQLSAAQSAAQAQILQHPAMGVIQRILNADDIVPFFDAHLWKSELQNTLQGTYEKAVKKQVTGITQKLAGSLRDALSIHQPYNEATAAYAKIVPLYTKEYAAKLRRAALTDPESLVRMIDPRKPTAARMLRDVIVTQSAEGGQAARGQAAWDLVRSAWTHDHVFKGGLAQLETNLGKLPKEFADVFYGDESGAVVLQNLQAIASAYKAALESGAREIAGAKAAGQAGVEGARRAGETAVEAAMRQQAALRGQAAAGVEAARATGRAEVETTRRVAQSTVDQATREAAGVRRLATADVTAARRARRIARAPSIEEIRFGRSSLAGRQPTLEELAAHGIRAFVLGPTQIWGGLSWLKLLRGPAEKDLIEWAAYSSANTQRFVRLVTGPSPTGMAIADLLRAAGIMGDEPLTPAGRPSRRVGAPPPR